METIFMNTENSKIGEPYKFALTLLLRLDLRGSNKHVALEKLFIYYTMKIKRQKSRKN